MRPTYFYQTRMKNIVTATLVTVLTVTALSGSVPFDYSLLYYRMRATDENITDLRIINRQPLVYQAWGVWSIPRSVQQVALVALDFPRYPEMFKYVYRCEQVTGPSYVIKPLGTWYLEGRAMRARVWAIGNIDTLMWCNDSTEVRLIASQNANRALNAQWRVRLQNWINFITLDLRLAAIVTAKGPDSCRVGIVAQSRVNKPMPDWLSRLAVNVILPRMFEDIEREVVTRYPVQHLTKKNPEDSPGTEQATKKWWQFWK
jgi:hypothetical protein